MTALVDLYDEHPREVEYELIRVGLRWRDFPGRDFTWGDLAAVVACADPRSPLGVAITPENAASSDTHLLRSLEHSARWLVWSKTRDAERGGTPPPPWRFAWEDAADTDDGFAADPMDMGEAARWLGWEHLIEQENEHRAAVGKPLIPT